MVDEGLEATAARARLAAAGCVDDDPVVRLFDAMANPAYLYRREGNDFRLERANAAAVAFTAGRIAQIVGRLASELFAERSTEVREDLARAYAGRTSVRSSMVHQLLSTGEVKDLAVTYTYVPPDRVVIETQDLTPTREITATLRETEQRYESVVAAMAEGVMMFDAANRVVACNASALALLGVTAEQVHLIDGADPLWHVVREDGTRLVPEEYPSRIALGAGRPVRDALLGFARAPGETVWALVNAQPLVRPGERAPYAAVVTFTDVTQRRQLEEQLAQSQKLESIGRLAGGVAHDFNNLLTAILASVGFAERQAEPALREDLETIRAAAERAASLTRQLLAFARRQVVTLRVLDLNDVVTKVSSLVRRLVGEDIELVTSLSRELRPVSADAVQLEQVLVNLVVNARDAMPVGGRLAIETANATVAAADAAARQPDLPPGEYATLAVTDTGSGMDEATRRHVFEPFFTTKPAGTGLGLASCYGIVRQLGGDITVESEPGRGSTFRVYLPCAAGDAPAPRAFERAADASRAAVRGSETVLLVEDEALVRTMAARGLAALGYRVLSAAGGHEALAIARAEHASIAALVTDVVMPQMSGRQLVEQFTALCPAARVLYVSGYTDDVVVRHGVLDGGHAFLQKPYTAETLASRLRELLDAR